MRFEKGHKQATRQRIVEVASEKFRAEGVEAVGIAGLMAAAGLTHGGFYAHFESKEALVREALDAAFEASRAKYDKGLEGFLRSYLRPAHRDNPGRGCAFAALTAEIARHPAETRAAFSARMAGFIARIGALLPETLAAPARQQAAIGILGVMMGTLQMARAMTDEKFSSEILESGVTAALRLAAAAKNAT
jgi:AcrR family transcriptional regulator